MPATYLEPTDLLLLDAGLVEKILVRFIRDEITRTGLKRATLGLSGGVDSAVSLALAVRALGPENVLPVIMPYKTSADESLQHARLAAASCGIPKHFEVDITPQIDAYFANEESIPASRDEKTDKNRRGNKMARERMTILYDVSYAESALVVGTSNKTELLLGYGTLFGDMASAVNPLGDLYKTQIYQLAEKLGVPEPILAKAPSADLWPNQTDEDEIGFSYRVIDELLYKMVDLRLSAKELEDAGYDSKLIERISVLIKRSQFKRRMPVIAKLSSRTVDKDFRYSRDWGT